MPQNEGRHIRLPQTWIAALAELGGFDGAGVLKPGLDALDVGRIAVAQDALAFRGAGEGEDVGAELLDIGGSDSIG